MRALHGIRTGGAALLLALVLAAPCRAQLPPVQGVDSEPPVARGNVAVRVLNRGDCLMGLRVKVNGEVKGAMPVPAHDWRSIHVHPDTASTIEVEVLADPRLCPSSGPSSTPPTDAPSVPQRTPSPKAIYVRRADA